MKSFKIFLKKREIFFDRKFHRNILEVLQNNQIPIGYQCQLGFCGLCKVYLKKGDISYFYRPIALLKSKEILTCICRPVNNIVIEIC
ncbi:class I ribonucleotide reductase maintenance protein YfaE [Candidatus Riesia pediculicola]|uniref:Adrenodoxin family ferredoxin n=1 Tax=Riesia pediculicola (strain USDA) TaxID=515618 RepID=D4G7N2_RIEPU|nr:class I ribonucleotide reductase maintenance protein YfaE [Candidatus Riesia pediculicola]ADD79571.1 adrenodoxin family ferredoxin [Candidatus Riesia pediculicola USDA]ARC53608.1 ferredoxin [Candidatus Riesia pediculicola]ARC54516.1 ferredoxin [Candidatus Riesia pediculicola]QOJ86260.1 2Fe-2S iron-sulfur cluster binding domain-containing protein [Candidatus Riesia pediculicola]